ncbi:MAG: putative F0F1-ATPase subunit Ca2+/Mg2+ transporter [Actinomycetota bacterium]|jgi:F0F1-type ATP synthase assembly protein I
MDFAVRLLPKPKPMAPIDSSISNGAELAGGVLVFFLIGFGLDMWLGTTPWFMIGLVIFGVVGQFVKMYYEYSARMEMLERERAQSARGIPE